MASQKDLNKMIPRFKEVCCSKLCSSWENCKQNDKKDYTSCPWFFGYRIYGIPVKSLCDYSYNAPKFPDLRIEEASDEFIKWWKEERNTTKKRVN